MAMEFELTEDAVGESNFVDQPGTYHFQIMDVKESQGPKGNLIDGFTFTLSVLAGTVKSEVGKTFNLTMFKPKLTEKDGGKGIFKADPFQSLDQEGVGLLVKMGIEKGRSTRKDLKVGICGEHGGELNSVKFCHKVGMNYVSCSPYRVPIARLAAAQAAVADKLAAKGAKKPAKKATKKK